MVQELEYDIKCRIATLVRQSAAQTALYRCGRCSVAHRHGAKRRRSSRFDRLQLPSHLWRDDALEFYGHCSFMKGGLVFADYITTVSPGYAREICEQPGGMGLEGLLSERRERLVGILNGIDTATWDPAGDAYVEQRYDADSLDDKIYSAVREQAGKKGLLYEAGEFLSVHEYTNVIRWTDQLMQRPAVQRGRMVNRVWGEPSSQLPERHDASDFEPDDYGRPLDVFMSEIQGRLPDGTWVSGVEVFRRIYSAIGLDDNVVTCMDIQGTEIPEEASTTTLE